ncbi:hypothetical protein [Salininema proteolyticum]|uniref:SPOR domain-containing protein n=1 Tax=Salininema proteolyticum TaxID=1607685 RepID=A0ABV8U0U8_9ACTN
MEQWSVIVNELQNVNTPYVARVLEGPYATRDEALSRARSLAFEYKPKHPTFDKGRRVFEAPDGGITVFMRGAVSEHSFSLSVARELEPPRRAAPRPPRGRDY